MNFRLRDRLIVNYPFLASDGTKPHRDSFLGYPDFAFNDKTPQRYGYTLRHEFSENLQIRNSFSAVNSNHEEVFFNPTNLVNDRTLNLTGIQYQYSQNSYFAQIDVLGKLKTARFHINS